MLCFEKSKKFIIFEKKTDMGITIDKENYVVVKTSYGYYTDNQGIIYPFSVDISETQGEQRWIEISWDDDTPGNIDDIEVELLEMF
jgi:hypothetical protein